MNLKKIEKATKIIVRIKELDKEIIEIERNAMFIANNDVNPSITMSFDKIKSKEEKENILDEDGSIKSSDAVDSISALYSSLMTWGDVTKTNDDKDSSKFKYNVRETELLEVMGVLIKNRMSERERLIKMIEKLKV